MTGRKEDDSFISLLSLGNRCNRPSRRNLVLWRQFESLRKHHSEVNGNNSFLPPILASHSSPLPHTNDKGASILSPLHSHCHILTCLKLFVKSRPSLRTGN